MRLNIRAHDIATKSTERIAAGAERYGFSGVQLVAYKACESVAYERGGIDGEKALAIKNVLKRHRQEVVLIGAYFNPVHSDKEKVSKCRDIFKEYIDVAGVLGCDYIGSETGSYNDDKWTYNPLNRTEEALSRVTDVFGELAGYARQKGRMMAVEGAWGHVCHTPERLQELRERIGIDKTKVIFDLFNYLYEGNFAERNRILKEGLKLFGSDIIAFHLKDGVVEGGFRQVPIGRGEFDYGEILGSINEVVPNAQLVFEGTTGDDIGYGVEYISKKAEEVGVEIEE